MILVLLENNFGAHPADFKRAVIADLQRHVIIGGMTGTVVGVWDGGDGRIEFMGPSGWDHLFKGIDAQWLGENLNLALGWWDN